MGCTVYGSLTLLFLSYKQDTTFLKKEIKINKNIQNRIHVYVTVRTNIYSLSISNSILLLNQKLCRQDDSHYFLICFHGTVLFCQHPFSWIEMCFLFFKYTMTACIINLFFCDITSCYMQNLMQNSFQLKKKKGVFLLS